ncbi:PEP-CTERM sorting domain-containing protein [Thioalkalivibrio sp. ALJ24]|uniref:PEP-CTERM sorting domain-containing protein n=1 Tax=Thioalkalivibrio sp. ALJ24 TaxID=545276 RepID=UPI0003648CFD|nr:PEP-CTERM sorting domain-containing protein [Thioalkalivibrio sp. ALJ24]
MKTRFFGAAALLAGGMACSVANAALIDLPNVDETYDGIPLTLQFNDFYSYSGSLLRQWDYLTQDQYTGQGTGTLDLIVGTGSGGANNQDIGPGGDYYFEDPMPFPSGSTSEFSGSWGIGDQDNGPVLVDDLVDYLDAVNPGATIPVFLFDHNQTGGQPDLLVRAQVYIEDPSTGERVASWYFDDGTGDWALASGEVELVGDSGEQYVANHNLGSGRLDYIVFAPTMDLSLYTGSNYWFGIDFEMDDLNNGFEELFLSGRFVIDNGEVPVPASMWLFGAGLLALGWFYRRRAPVASPAPAGGSPSVH